MSTITDKKNKIQCIVNVFETGTVKGDYSNISIYNDGPNGIKQITYGKSQTTEFGNLKKLIELYVEKQGAYAKFFSPYIPNIGKKLLFEDKEFVKSLKLAGADPIMVKSQDEFFDLHYWTPALKFCTTNQFITPLAGLTIYDSYIHSGGVLAFLRNRFSEKVPIAGGNEQKWVAEYLKVRKIWLENHTIPILRKTVYRVNDMIKAVNNGDWNLEKPFLANGVSVDVV